MIHNHDAAGVELQPFLKVLGVVVERHLTRDEEQGIVGNHALHVGVDDLQRIVPVEELGLVELVVLLRGNLALLLFPDRHHAVEALVLPVGLVLRLIILFGLFLLRRFLHLGLLHVHHDWVPDVIGVFGNQAAQAIFLQELIVFVVLGVVPQSQLNGGAHLVPAAILHGITVGTVTDPYVGLLLSPLAGSYLDVFRYHKSTIESHAELSDDVGVFRGLFVLRLKAQGTALGDDSQILLQLLRGHSDAVIGNGQGAGILVRLNPNLEILPGKSGLAALGLLVITLVNGIAGIADNLPQENLPVGVNGVNHQIQHPLGFCFELFFAHLVIPSFYLYLFHFHKNRIGGC